MMEREDMMALAERVEKASGPDRALDWDVHIHAGLEGVGMYGAHPAYTASLDAAMTLVPAGCKEWHCGKHFKTGQGQAYLLDPATMRDPVYVLAATPALALTAACLRALTPALHNG